MKTTSAFLLGLGLIATGLAFTPTASANLGVCADDIYNDDYTECFGVMDSCGAAGVGHWYTYGGTGTNPPAGQEGGWCWLYVTTGSGDIAAVCTETEAHVYDDCIVTIG